MDPIIANPKNINEHIGKTQDKNFPKLLRIVPGSAKAPNTANPKIIKFKQYPNNVFIKFFDFFIKKDWGNRLLSVPPLVTRWTGTLERHRVITCCNEPCHSRHCIPVYMIDHLRR